MSKNGLTASQVLSSVRQRQVEHVSCSIPPRLHAKVKALAAREQSTVSEVMRLAAEFFFAHLDAEERDTDSE